MIVDGDLHGVLNFSLLGKVKRAVIGWSELPVGGLSPQAVRQ